MKLHPIFIITLLVLVIAQSVIGYSENKTRLSLTLLHKDKNNTFHSIENIVSKGKYFINFTINKDGYASLWRINSSNQITRLYPNKEHSGARVKRAENYSVSSKALHVEGKAGFESYLLLWTQNKSDQPVLPVNPTTAISQKNLQGQLKKIIVSNTVKTARARLKIFDADQVSFLSQEGNKNPNKMLKLTGHHGKVYILAMSANVPPLRRTHKDAGNFIKTMKRLFSNNGNQVIVRRKTNVNAKDFKDSINWLKKAKKNDLIFIYFSGHGTQIDDKGTDERDRKDEAFVLKNKEIVTDDTFFRWVSQLGSRNVITVVDACFSKGLRKTGIEIEESIIKYYDFNTHEKNKIEATKEPPAILDKNTLIGSAPENGIARESPEGGVFTNRLINALSSTRNTGLSLRKIFIKVSGNNIVWDKKENMILRTIKLSQ